MQDFRKLDVWARAHAFAKTIRALVRVFPAASTEFKEQLVSAAESIASNIVEGCGTASNKELARYLDISIKSAFEVDYRLELAKEYEYISEAEWTDLFAELIVIRKMTYRFRASVMRRDERRPVRQRPGRHKPT